LATLKLYRWLAGKRIDDNAEGLWRVHDKLYDLSDFVEKHPGGRDWIKVTKGTDITEQFETHHINATKAEQLLNTFFIRDASLKRNYKFTYKDDGFYRTMKRRVADILPELDTKPKKMSEVSVSMNALFCLLFSLSLY
jgi:cytochrome b involved in lipid metabolism